MSQEQAKQHLDASLNRLRLIFEALSNRIEAIKPGEKYPATKMVDEVGLQFGIKGVVLYHTFKSFLITNYPDVVLDRGRYGGIRRLLPGEVAPAEPIEE